MVTVPRSGVTAKDALLATLLAGVAAGVAVLWPGVRDLDAPGALLLAAAHLPLAVIRRWPAPGLAALVAPALLAPGALPGADGIAGLARDARAGGLDVDLREGDVGPLPPEIGVAAYRIVQGALTNAVKHAAATRVEVSLARDGGDLVVRVADDGKGPSGDTPGGFGILGMIERARGVGGMLDAGPGPKGGFAVTAVLPLAGAAAPR
ncbi:ATP-binding protein [Actinomadura sp. B10D3]|uniref:sensor histidine kinase n=1 Tax=Actinomadura sp. B10D3 TaxID=3153557 RepID=UPI00325D2B7B